MGLELRYVVRSILTRPLFSLVVVLTIALAIAATTTTFSVVNGVLLEPLPYPDPDRLVSVWEHNRPRERDRNVVSPANYLAWRDESVFEDMAAVVAASGTITGDGEPERIGVVTASAPFFELLGAGTVAGRVYTVAEDSEGGEDVGVISHGFWQRRFGGDPSIVGRTIQLNQQPLTIVGVLEPGFDFDYAAQFSFTGSADLFVPHQFGEEARGFSGRYLQVIARVPGGTTIAAASQRMTDIAQRLEATYPERNTGWGVNVVALREQTVGDIERTLLVIFGAVAFVLLIACANVANLMLTRASERHQEVAVRAALGASRWRITRQTLVESLTLATIGGLLGLLLAAWAVSGLLALAPDLPRLQNIALDTTVTLFAFGTTAFAGLLFGMAPALQTLRSDLVTWLRGRAGEGGRREARRLRSALVVSEIALSLMLLIGAGLLIRSLTRMIDVGVGFDTNNVLTATIDLPGTRYSEPEQIRGFFEQLVERVSALAGVEQASAITWAPLMGGGTGTSFWTNDRPEPQAGEYPSANIRWVHRDFHETLRIPLVEGRYFDETDVSGAPNRVIINETMRQEFWPGQSAIGQQITMPWNAQEVGEVVGVVRDIKHNGPRDEPGSMIYWNAAQFMGFDFMTLVVRTSGDPTQLVGAVRGSVAALDPDLPAYSIRTMDQLMSDALAQTRFITLTLGVFATLAFLLACIGVYGVMSYVTGRRIQEFGVRMALGADSRMVVRLVVRQGALLIATAIAIGITGSLLISSLLENLVFDVGTTDPLTFAAMSVLLGSVALVACWLPARRAAAISPVRAIRSE
jgi:putative ABC transport system permease protein